MNDRYEILDVVGAGGMATVWRARDRQLGRMVAIKRPHPAPADSTIHERFQREARAAAAVSHPNLVTVYDAASDDEGPYLVMELVDAPSLADSRVDPAEAASIGASLADALAALHAVDIVHRDIKPSNILLAAGGPQLTDFGIARSLDANDDVTQVGVNLGTPSYAPPESLAGAGHGEAGDVYSLAVVIHEMFTGERFAGPGGTQVMVGDRLLRPILEPALATDPTQRPTAEMFARSLESIRANALVADDTQAMGSAPRSAEIDSSAASPVDMIGAPVSSTIVDGMEERWRTADRNSRGIAILLAGCALLAVALLVVGVTRDSSDSEAVADTGPVESSLPEAAERPADADAEAVLAPDPRLQAIADTRSAFDGLVGGLSDDVFKDRERTRVLDEVAEAVDDAARGELDRAAKGFEDAAKRLDKVEDEAVRGQTIQLLRDLAASLDVVIDV